MFDNLRPDKSQYVPLDGQRTSLRQRAYRYCVCSVQFWREALILCLCILVAVLTFERAFTLPTEKDRAKVPDYRLTSDDSRWRQFQWYSSIYSSTETKDDEAVNAAWDKIIPAHGIVAVDHHWAADRNLPASMSLPSDSSKGVYIIDAYHQIHCLTIIRKTFIEIAEGKTPSVPLQHSRHCFDSLLQYIMCGNSGDTLLYTWGRNETGDGQIRKCIDWNSRKQWAKENTACYADDDHPIPLYDHFDHCENDDDGIHVD